MTALPHDPVTTAVLAVLDGGPADLTAGRVQDALRGQQGLAPRLIGDLDAASGWGVVTPGTPVDRAGWLDRAQREAERQGRAWIAGEHLVLGLLRSAAERDPAAGPALDGARALLQAAVADLAGAAYEQLTPVAEPARPAVLLLLAGLPGTGKSTLAEALGRRLRAPVFSVDWQLGALTPFGLVRPDNGVPLADQLLTAAAARQLQLGLDVVLDTTGHLAATRRRWQRIAEKLRARFVGVECVCSDEEAHRGRVRVRSRGIPGWPATVSWEHVERMRARWEVWEEPHLVVDTVVPRERCEELIEEAIRDR